MSGQQHTAEGTTVTVKASPEWIAKDICACAHAAKSPEAMMAVVEMATGYLTRLATAESALAGIRDPAAFVKRAKAIERTMNDIAFGTQGHAEESDARVIDIITDKARAALALPGGES